MSAISAMFLAKIHANVINSNEAEALIQYDRYVPYCRMSSVNICICMQSTN